ncbi:GH92 family glycosyl hydrolase [Marinoscillum furvescens]|nr:GH92 family glycosyl hydrolase [Marinoscillum furvescens]
MNTKKLALGIGTIWMSMLLLTSGCGSRSAERPTVEPVDYVDPYIGNISHLLVPTYPTIHLPNSMLRLYPERRDFTGDMLKGLPSVVTGHRRGSAFHISPFQGDKSKLRPVVNYSYDLEEIKPYAYSVYLDEALINVDFGVSHQSAMYAFEFEKEEPVSLVLNSLNGAVKWDGEAFSGYQLIENNTKIYLYLKPAAQPKAVNALVGGKLVDAQEASGRNACLVLDYGTDISALELQYGISFIDEAQARQNMEREVVGKSLAEIQSIGRDLWNQTLGKISVSGTDEDAKKVFYTSLYRTFERPVCLSEDGRYYSAFDGTIHQDNGRPFYTDDWIWDSYRAHHPLNVLIDSEKENDILHSFILMAEQMDNMWMPTFPEVSGDSRRMNSNHAVASVIDAYRKGLRGFDLEKAFLACKGAITEKTLAPWSGMPAGELDQFYKDEGYFPALPEGVEETVPEVHGFESRQPVAVTLGTSYDEWCLAQIAKELDREEDYKKHLENSYNYRNLFHAQTHFFHPKDAQGNFIEPFDYRFSGGMGARKFYGENNGWVYRWDVQHNVSDLVGLMGGPEQFVANLNATFNEPLGRSKYGFYAQLPDHTGNVGQFSMANEPSLHVPYLYNYAGQPWKTQKRIRTLMDQWFRNDLMGVPGDEDGGGMTSFVVFSQLGFYPVTPGLAMYNIGSPEFEKASITLPNGKTFTITAENYAPEHKYIQSATLNGAPLDQPYFWHDDIRDGGELTVVMGSKANFEWGANQAPPSGVSNEEFQQLDL